MQQTWSQLHSHAHQPCNQSSMLCLSPLTPLACCVGSHIHWQASAFDAADWVAAAQPCSGALGLLPTQHAVSAIIHSPARCAGIHKHYSTAALHAAQLKRLSKWTVPATISMLMGAHAGIEISSPDLLPPAQPRRSALSPRWHAAMSDAPEQAPGSG